MLPNASTSRRALPFWSKALFAGAFLFVCVSAQSSTSAITSASPSYKTTIPSSSSFTQSTTFSTITSTILSGHRNVPITTTIPVVLTLAVTPTHIPSSASTAPNSTSIVTATPTPQPDQLDNSSQPVVLDTRIDGAFGVLGALLILTGIPNAFLGHKNRWSSFFIIGFYTMALVCFVLILKYGILQAINPPDATLRGLFVLSCGVAGVAGGGVAIFFWKLSKYFIGAWGGFAFALWIQAFRDGGLVRPIGFRWVMYIALGVVGFILCTVPKLHYYVLLASTAFVGASAFMLGVDCFTTANLKEFYIWNLGFTTLFPKYHDNGIQFPVSQTMQIELGLLGAVALMGMAVQFRILQVLKRKLKEIEAERKREDEEAVARAAERFAEFEKEKVEWEREHPGLLFKHGRMDSEVSSSQLLKDEDTPGTPTGERRRSSTFTLVGTPGGTRERLKSGISDFVAAPTPKEELQRAARQRPGALPALDLGMDIEKDVPLDYLTEIDQAPNSNTIAKTSLADLEELKRKQELLAEIQTIRRSIDVLKSETPTPTESSESRHLSFNSKRTLSYDMGSLVSGPGPSHLRPPRQQDPRARVQSMGLWNASTSRDAESATGRANSTPLQDDDWDAYIRDRKLLQPPSGVTPPIATSPLSPAPRPAVSPAVVDALQQRQRRESTLSFNQLGRATPEMPHESNSGHKDSSSDDVPVALRAHKRTTSSGGNIPMTILPPRKGSSPTRRSPESRVRTFEELAERHREKIRELQAPLTRAETEQADIKAARERWEKVKVTERQAVAKRQNEKAAQFKEASKRRASGDEHRSSQLLDAGASGSRHSRSLSADVLGAVNGSRSSKRLSAMKVEDWQRGQQDVELGQRQRQRRSSSLVPFPESKAPQVPPPARERRGSHRLSGLVRDPPT